MPWKNRPQLLKSKHLSISIDHPTDHPTVDFFNLNSDNATSSDNVKPSVSPESGIFKAMEWMLFIGDGLYLGFGHAQNHYFTQ